MIDLTRHPEEIEKQKDRFALRYQGFGSSGIDIDDDDEAERGEFEIGGF